LQSIGSILLPWRYDASLSALSCAQAWWLARDHYPLRPSNSLRVSLSGVHCQKWLQHLGRRPQNRCLMTGTWPSNGSITPSAVDQRWPTRPNPTPRHWAIGQSLAGNNRTPVRARG